MTTANTITNISYTGTTQTGNVTATYGIPVTAYIWGAGGGSTALYPGAGGGYSQVNFVANPGDSIAVVVGQGGGAGGGAGGSPPANFPAGPGGSGGSGDEDTSSVPGSGGGGGGRCGGFPQGNICADSGSPGGGWGQAGSPGPAGGGGSAGNAIRRRSGAYYVVLTSGTTAGSTVTF